MIIDKIINIVGSILILMMILFPNILQVPKAFLLSVVIFGTILRSKNIVIKTNHLLWISLYICSNFLFIFYGIALGNPAPLKYFPTYILWPILFFLIAQNMKLYSITKLSSIFVYCLFFINCVGIISFILFNINFTSNSFILFGPLIKPGFPFFAISGPVVTSFIFLFFYNLAMVLISKKKSKIEIANVVLGLIFILLTSRRVLFLNVVIGIFVIYFFALMSKPYSKCIISKLFKLIIGFLILFFTIFSIAIVYVEYSFSDFMDLIVSAFGDGDIDDPRVEQSIALFNGWLENPVLGNGTGVDASISRSDLPGTYELSYHAMLFERGVLGVLVYVLLYIVMNVWCIRSMRYSTLDNKYIIAYLVALTLFMIANATNPYLNAFDYLWIYFLGFVFCNRNCTHNNINLSM